MEVVEARLNVMQAVFLAIQTSLSLGADILLKGQQVFQTLFNRYFTEALEVPMWGGEGGREGWKGRREGGVECGREGGREGVECGREGGREGGWEEREGSGV